MCTPWSIESRREGVCFPSPCLDGSKQEEDAPRQGALLPVAGHSLLAQRLLSLKGCARGLAPGARRKRQMTPEDKKDASYWDKRRKNNESAKRSRERRRLNDYMLEGQLLALSKENTKLRTEMLRMRYHAGLGKEQPPLGPLHRLASSPLKPSLWHFASSTSALLGEKDDINNLLQGSKASWTGLSTSSATGQSQCYQRSLPSNWEVPPGSQQYLQSYHNSLKRPCVSPVRQQEKPSFTAAMKHEQQRQAEPDSTANYQLPESQAFSNLQLPCSLRSPSSFSSFTHVPSSRLLPGVGDPLMCSSLILPWSTPGLHLSPIYCNSPLYLPLEGPPFPQQSVDVHQNLRSRTDSSPTDLAHLRRYFLSERC